MQCRISGKNMNANRSGILKNNANLHGNKEDELVMETGT
jgi:hypothetical protein